MLKQKSDVFKTFKQVLVEKQTEKKIKCIRTYNNMKFCPNEFEEFCRDEGISRYHTVKETPQ